MKKFKNIKIGGIDVQINIPVFHHEVAVERTDGPDFSADALPGFQHFGISQDF